MITGIVINSSACGGPGGGSPPLILLRALYKRTRNVANLINILQNCPARSAARRERHKKKGLERSKSKPLRISPAFSEDSSPGVRHRDSAHRLARDRLLYLTVATIPEEFSLIALLRAHFQE